MYSRDGQDDTAPLLSSQPGPPRDAAVTLSDGAEEVAYINAEVIEEQNVQQRPQINRKFFMVWLTFLLFLFDFAIFVALPGQTMVFERIVCRKYMARLGHGIGASQLLEDPCRAEPVQSELGYIMGWKDTFETLPGMRLGWPYRSINMLTHCRSYCYRPVLRPTWRSLGPKTCSDALTCWSFSHRVCYPSDLYVDVCVPLALI